MLPTGAENKREGLSKKPPEQDESVTDTQGQHGKDPRNTHSGRVPMGDDRGDITPRSDAWMLKSRKWRTEVMRLLSKQPLFTAFPHLRIHQQ